MARLCFGIRRRIFLLVGAVAYAAVAGQALQPQAPTEAMRKARASLGGDQALAQISSLRFVGTRRGLNLADGKLHDPRRVDIRVLLTGGFRRDEARENGSVSRTGFHGDKLLSGIVRSGQFRAASGTAEAIKQQVVVERNKLGRLLLALLGDTSSIVDFSVSAGPAPQSVLCEADGMAPTVMEFDEFGRPHRLTYRSRVALPGVSAGAPEFTSTDVTMTLADYRKVGGVTLPHRIATAAGDVILEVWQVSAVELNTLDTLEGVD